MPRKTSTDSEADYRRVDYDRWRALARNRDFCKDLVDYLINCGPDLSSEWRKRPVLSRKQVKHFIRLQKQYLDKWGIEQVPDPDLWQEANPMVTPEGLERWYKAARTQRPDFTAGIASPVCMSQIRRGSRAEIRYVEFRLDVSLPVDQLIALMDGELRRWYWKHIGNHPRGKRTSLDFQLKVFDLYRSPADRTPLTFQDIARKLKRTPSTVRDAYYSACKKIELRDESVWTRKSGQPTRDPGLFSECSNHQCRNAETDNDFCAAHRAWIEQDRVSGDLPVEEFWPGATSIFNPANSPEATASDDSAD